MSTQFFMSKIASAAAGLAAFVLMAGNAHAVTFTFADLDGAGTGPSVAGQFTVDVTSTGGGSQISFKFTNAGPLASAFEQINFDDSANGFLASVASIVNGTGVDFESDLKNLPQGNSVGFTSTYGFQATPPPGGSGGNSINPTEMLTLVFNLNGTFNAAIAALENGALRIGTHVISLPDGSSDTLLTDIPDVPIPAALPLLLTGLAGFSLAGRRRKKA